MSPYGPPKSGFSKGAGPGVAARPIGKLADLLGDALDRAGARQRGEELPVPMPWANLNHTLGGGLWPGNHFLVAGTGVGKSQFTFQTALHAAKQGVPVGLIALELDEMSLAIRIAAEESGVTWSKVYNGKASDDEMLRIRAVAPKIASLNIRTDFGQAMGWGYDRLELMAKALRETNKKGPILIVLDFIQLIASPEDQRPVDLRERIGLAGYQARNVSRMYDASIVIISSTARQNYGSLNEKLSKTGLSVDQGHWGSRRIVRYPDNLIGLGKESGELEFSADSLTVLMRPTITAGQHDDAIGTLLARGGKVVTCVTPKVRAGIPSWFALAFEKGRFAEMSDDTANSLVAKQEEEESPEDQADKVVDAITEREATHPLEPFTSHEALAQAVGMAKSKVSRILRSLTQENRIEKRGETYIPAKPL
jgi:hypothetical protein